MRGVLDSSRSSGPLEDEVASEVTTRVRVIFFKMQNQGKACMNTLQAKVSLE
jgi:hypothetical protein